MTSDLLAPRPPAKPVVVRALESAAIGVGVGAVWGVLIGGVGGRIAMRVVFLTSNESLRGITSDDGFEIGRFSGETAALLIFTGVLGAIAGSLYGLLRLVWAGPRWALVGGAAVAMGAAAGGAIVHPTGIDFVFLEPLWLTVGLFVLLPAAWGAAVVATTESERLAAVPLPDRPTGWTVGIVGWIVAAALSVMGIVELIDDVRALT